MISGQEPVRHCLVGQVPGIQHKDLSRSRMQSRLPTDEYSTMNVEIDYTRYWGLRLLTNFQLNDRFLLTVVLIGQPELRRRVAGIPQLNQRVAVRAHEGRDRPDRRVYKRRGVSHIRTEQGDRTAR